jgi:transcription initiation factor TFIID TATA-box-binding protein
MRIVYPSISIVNFVATASLGQSVDLEKLLLIEGFLYDSSLYRCAYLKDKRTKAKVIIFGTGKMISAGAKSFVDAKHDLEYAERRLVKIGLIKPIKITVRVQNVVATGDIGQPVDIERLSTRLPNIIYEPEQFPGAIYYAKELEGASILIFASGKVVFAGLKRQELLEVGKRVLKDLAGMV